MANNLLILDFDGVMTDGTKVYGPDGQPAFKSCADIDFTAIKLFWTKGWKVCVLSSDDWNRQLCSNRKIDFWHSRHPDGKIDKAVMYHQLLRHYQTHSFNVVYVGDDFTDVPIMNAVRDYGGKIYCPLNSAPYVKSIARLIHATGGHGAIMELYNSMFGNDVNIMGVQY